MRPFFCFFSIFPLFFFPLSGDIGEDSPLLEKAPINFPTLEKAAENSNPPAIPPSPESPLTGSGQNLPEEAVVTELDRKLAFLEEILEKRDYERFRCLARDAFDSWDDEALRDLEELAYKNDVFDISLELGRRFQDLEEWGMSAFELGAYSEAYWVLLELFETEEKPTYQVPHAIGEIFWFWERKCEAYTYFRIAKQRIEQVLAEAKVEDDEDEIISARLALASIHYLERNEIGALNNLNDLLNHYPDHYSIAATYAYFLAESGYYRSAKCVFDAYLTTPWEQWDEFETEKGASLMNLYIEKVRYLRLIGHQEAAFALLYPLIERQETIPNPDIIWGSLAEVEVVSDYFRQAASSYCIALDENPVSEIYPHDWWEAYQFHRSFFYGEGELLHTIPGQNEHIYRGNLFERFGLPHFLDTTFEVDHYSVIDVQDALTGDLENQKGDRWRLFVNYGFDSYNANQLILGLYFAQSIVGGKAIFTAKDDRGQTFIEGNYHYPSWEIIEATTQRGLYDQVKFGRTHYFNRKFYFDGWTAYKVWGVAGLHNVATSWATYWDLIWTFENLFTERYLGENGSINLIYNLDAEYIFNRKFGITSDGTALYELLPLITQETHSFYLYVNKEFSPTFRAEAFGGYSANRHGTTAPDYGLKLIWKKKNCWRAVANYTHQAGTTVQDSTVEQFLIGAYVYF